MVVGVLLAAALAGSPQADASPAPTPLREIGRIRASAACSTIVVHANSAISAALRNDSTLTQTISRLRTADLDGNVIVRRNQMQELSRLAVEMRREAVRGDGEVKRLRDLAEKSTDEARKVELKTFADALGGALYRQKKIASDMLSMMAYFDYDQMRRAGSEYDRERSWTMQTTGSNDPFLPRGERYTMRDLSQLSYERNAPHLNEMTRAAAKDFEDRIGAIAGDEAKAADHTEGAVSGCP